MFKTLRFTLVSLLMMLCGTVFAEDKEETLTLGTTAGYAELTVDKAGANSTGAEMSFSKGDIVVTSDLGYIKDHEMTIYKNGTMTISLKEGVNAHITKVELIVKNYHFAGTDDTDWTPGDTYAYATSNDKISSNEDESYTTTATDKKSLTVKNASPGKTTVNTIKVYYTTDANSEPEQSWVAPTIEGEDPVSGSNYKVLNVGSGKILAMGKAWFSWATTAIVAEDGFAATFTGDAASFTLTNTGNNKFVFTSGNNIQGDAMHADGGTATNYGLTKLPNGNYRIHDAGGNAESLCWGYNSNFHATGIVAHADATAEGWNCEWIFLASDIDINIVNFYVAKKALYEALVLAKEQGIATDEASAVYTKSDATVDELNAATDKLKHATNLVINTKTVEGASVTSPVTTAFVINGTFDTNGVVAPWQTTGGFQNQTTANNQQGAFTGNFFENWNPSAKENKMYQVIEDIPNGIYLLKIAAFVNTLANPNESQYVFANTDKTFLSTGEPTAYEVYTVVENNKIEIGLEQTTATAGWMGIDNISLTYFGADGTIDDAKNGAIIKELADLRAKATELKAQVEIDAVKTAIDEALAATAEVSGADAINAAIATVKAAVEKAEASILAKGLLPKMKQLVESTNVYTEAAKNEYYDQWVVKYEDGSLTKPEAQALQDPFLVTGWRAAVTVDNFLLSAWDTNPDFVDAPYYINTWSVEGDTDGSEFKVPFFEYFTEAPNSLGEKTLTATVNGLEAGYYNVSAWVRVQLKNDATESTGITLQANDGEAVNAADGAQIGTSNFYIKEVTALGIVGEDGVLKIKVNVAAVNTIHWLSFKNVKFEKTTAPVVKNYQAEIAFDKSQLPNWAFPETITVGEELKVPFTVSSYADDIENVVVKLFVNDAEADSKTIEKIVTDEELGEGSFTGAFSYKATAAGDLNIKLTLNFDGAELDEAGTHETEVETITAVAAEPEEPIINATLVHTATSYCEGEAETYTSKVDSEKEYVNNNKFNATWQGAAYAEFAFDALPANATVLKATLTFTGIGESRNARNTDVMLVNAGEKLDYEALTAGAAKVNLPATNIQSVSFPKGASEVFTIDATEQLNALAANGQRYAIFKFTNNPGGGHIAGKASEEAPTLVIEFAPGAPEIANASFEADGEKAASNGALELTGWTFKGVGTQFNNTELRAAGSTSTTSQFGTSDPKDGNYSLFFRQGWNGNGTVTTLESDALTEIPAGDYILSLAYKQHYSHDGNPSNNTTVGLSLVSGETTLATAQSPAAEGVQGASAATTYFNDAEWSVLEAGFTLAQAQAAGAKIVIALNAGGQRRSDFFIDDVKLVKAPGIEIALKDLEKAIAEAEAIAAKYTIGTELFTYPESEIKPLTDAIGTAKAAYEAKESKEAVVAATNTLNEFLAAFAPVVNKPEADKLYAITNKTAGLALGVGEEAVKLVKNAAVKFVEVEGGWLIANNAETPEYILKTAANTWTLSTTTVKEEAYVVNFNLADGDYTIQGANGLFGTDNVEEGSAVYANKSAANNGLWTIAEYTEPQPEVKKFEGYVAVSAATPDAPGTPMAGAATEAQTVSISEADADGKVSITFTGFTLAPMPFNTGEFKLTATATAKGDGSIEYTSEEQEIGLQLGQMIATYKATIEGTQASADETPVLVLKLQQATIFTVVFAKTADDAKAKVDEIYNVLTGINAVKANAQQGTVYNLNGQKMEKAQKGLYIINGKKVVIK